MMRTDRWVAWGLGVLVGVVVSLCVFQAVLFITVTAAGGSVRAYYCILTKSGAICQYEVSLPAPTVEP